jgi:hypothetical protein
MLDFVVVRLTEKTIWQAIENTGIPYEDWTAYKEPGQQLLKLFVELKEGHAIEAAVIASAVHGNIMNTNNADLDADSPLRDDFASTIDFKVEVTVLPSGSFANFMAQRQAKGADLAHLKPPHVNASNEVLAELMGEIEEIEVVKTKTATKAKEIAT